MSERKRPSRRWLRFSLRSLIVMVLLSSIGFAAFYYELRSAQRRRQVVEHLRDFPGLVQYENDEVTSRAEQAPTTAAGLSRRVHAWLTEKLGVDFFYDVRMVCLNGREQFSDTDLAETCQLRELKSLRLGRTLVTDRGLQPISDLTELESLSLSSPHLTDDAMTHIAQLRSLQRLSLYEVGVTDAGLAKLTALDHLQSVSLRKTSVTDAGATALETALPDCEVTLRK